MLSSPYFLEPLLEQEDWARLLRAASGSRYPCRDRAILHLLWWLALTVQDVLALRVEDVDFLAGRIRWGGGRHVGVLPPEALRSLTAYSSMERAPRCPALFGDAHGRALSPAHLSRIVQRHATAAGLPTSPHALRMSALYRLLARQPLHVLLTLRAEGGGALVRRAE